MRALGGAPQQSARGERTDRRQPLSPACSTSARPVRPPRLAPGSARRRLRSISTSSPAGRGRGDGRRAEFLSRAPGGKRRDSGAEPPHADVQLVAVVRRRRVRGRGAPPRLVEAGSEPEQRPGLREHGAPACSTDPGRRRSSPVVAPGATPGSEQAERRRRPWRRVVSSKCRPVAVAAAARRAPWFCLDAAPRARRPARRRPARARGPARATSAGRRRRHPRRRGRLEDGKEVDASRAAARRRRRTARRGDALSHLLVVSLFEERPHARRSAVALHEEALAQYAAVAADRGGIDRSHSHDSDPPAIPARQHDGSCSALANPPSASASPSPATRRSRRRDSEARLEGWLAAPGPAPCACAGVRGALRRR